VAETVAGRIQVVVLAVHQIGKIGIRRIGKLGKIGLLGLFCHAHIQLLGPIMPLSLNRMESLGLDLSKLPFMSTILAQLILIVLLTPFISLSQTPHGIWTPKPPHT
jgi:hypothetical protein